MQVIYPSDEKCVLCGEDICEDIYICPQCEKSIKFCEDVFIIEQQNIRLNCYSISYYSGNIMELILRLKYKSDFRAGEAIAKYMISTIRDKDIKFDFISYIPMTQIAMKKRGYNQSEYLAKVIGNEINKPVIHCLDKIKQTKDQIGLNGIERWNNVIDSFGAKNKNIIINKKILLVDDVLTTGATAFSCAHELLKCGAEKITVLTGAKSRV